jgi:hypothetical protein
MPFLEVSAKEGTNIDEIFYTLGRGIKQTYDRETTTDSCSGNTQISASGLKNSKSKKGCDC